MKPGHIRVFDGLRITTQHMNHLQGSFHSALQDIREIMGLGKVHRGFGVVREDNHTITVQPGLAFDLQKNRIVCEEPRTLTIQWNTGEKEKYVCLKYKQVEDGIVEDEPTIIWDTCDVEICQQLPAPEENVIVFAKLTRSENEDEGFEMVSLLPGDRAEEPGEEQENEDIDQLQTEEEGEPGETEAEIQEEDETGEAEEEGEPGEAAVEEEVDETEISEPAKEKKPVELNISQGVDYLPPDAEKEIDLAALLLEPLKKKLNSKVNTSGEELLFPLADKEVVLDSPARSLNCFTIINFNVNSSDSEEHIRFQSTAQGEVTITGDRVLQFGLSTVRFYPTGTGENPRTFSHLTEHGIAHLPMVLDGLYKIPGRKNIGVDTDILENLQVLVKVKEIESPGFKIICCLKWKGEITKELISKFKENKIMVTWKVSCAWKSLGDCFDK